MFKAKTKEGRKIHAEQLAAIKKQPISDKGKEFVNAAKAVRKKMNKKPIKKSI